MITLKDLYNVASAVVPLYLTMFVAYASVKWGKVFTPEQCAGINRFVAIFAVPLLSFEFISRINPYRLNNLFIAADVASKVIVLLVLLLCSKICRRGTLDLSITLFSLATLPNTLVMGIPLLKSMYGDDQEGLMIQVVVLQSIIWYTLLLFLFEYRAARIAVIQDSRQSNSESQVVSVVVAEPSLPETSQLRPQNSNKVAPDEEHGEGPCDHTKKQEEDKIAVLMILRMVWSKLIRNPNTYASLLGLGWALTSNRWNVKKPLIMDNSVTILSNAGLGMAMFSLGLFMALQPRIIACGKKMAACAMAMKFLVGPAVMALASVAVGLRGTTLKVSIVQAALPQGIVPFVFAREYNLHPDVLSTAVIFGMIVSLPVTILFYVFLGL